MKKDFIILIFMLCVAFFASCGNDGETIITDKEMELTSYTVTISASILGDSSIVNFSTTSGTAEVQYFIGSESDRNAFANGDLPGIESNEGDGAFTRNFTRLARGTEYTVFARAFDSKKKGYAVASEKIFIRPLSELFSAEMQYVSDHTAGIMIEVDRNTIYKVEYFMGSAADKEDFHNRDIKNIQEIIEIGSYTLNFFDLEPSTEYVLYFRYYDRINTVLDTDEILFNTFAAGDCPGLSKIESEIDVYTGTYRFIPNDKCGIMIAFISDKGIYDMPFIFNKDVWAGNLSDMLMSWVGINFSGTEKAEKGQTLVLNHTTPSMLVGQETEAYVLTFDENNNPAGVFRYSFSTPEYDSLLEAPSVEIEIINNTATSVTYQMTANMSTVVFYYEVFETQWYNNEFPNLTQYYPTLFDYLHYSSLFVPHHISNGTTHTVTDNGLYPDYDFFIGVYAINNNGVTIGVGPMNRLDFKTPTE